MNALIFIGPPACGKGTQQARLRSIFSGYQCIGTGDELRAIAASGSDLGKQVDATMKAGDPVSDAIVNAVVADKLSRLPPGALPLFDGYPRNIVQAQLLVATLQGVGLSKIVVFYFQQSPEDCRRRRKARLGEYAEKKLPLREDDLDDLVFEIRLASYQTLTLPAVHWLSEQPGITLLAFDAQMSIDDVTAALTGALQRIEAAA